MQSGLLNEYWKQFQTNTRKITYKEMQVISNDELQRLVADEAAAVKFCEQITGGTCVLVRGVMSKPALEAMQQFSRRFRTATEQSFHKMLDGVPDFHRIIDRDIAKLYSLYAIKHSHYMFRWNAKDLEMIKIWDEIDSYWRKMKYLGGFVDRAYESNLPSTGPTDRVQFVHYPAKGGVLHDHVDPDHNQRFVIGINMSTRGVEYDQGGFYVLDEAGARVDLEDQISVGDALVCDARLVHGVSEVDPDPSASTPEWNRESGRWYLGLYSNDSDHGKRVTATNLQST